MCVVYAPLTFSHDGEAKAVAKQSPGDDLETVRAAVEGCPMGALTLLVGDEGV
jgi:ferredoxin